MTSIKNETQKIFEMEEKELSIRILHIDDNEIFLDISKIYLEKYGNGQIHVDKLVDPTKALEILSKFNYDMIIADYQMPIINGFELLQVIRKAGVTIPFVILTGSGKEDDRVQALNIGVNHFIKKSSDLKNQFHELVHLICKIIKQKQIQEIYEECEKRFLSLIKKASKRKNKYKNGDK